MKKSNSIKVSNPKMSVSSAIQDEYEADFYLWIRHQTKLLKNRDFQKVDLENIIEEIESLGRSDKRALHSYLIVLLTHKLKKEYIPEQQGNSKSWDSSIVNSANGIMMIIEDSPSLKKELNSYLPKAYECAKDQASTDTCLDKIKFPKECPWNINELFPKLKKKY